MSLGSDRRGLESLPLKLAIVAIVAGISIVPAADALSTLRNREFVQMAASELDRIASVAETLAISGPGNARTLTVDFTSEGSVRFLALTIGDRLNGSNASALVLQLSTGASMVRTLSAPPICMTSSVGSAVEIEEPVFELKMTATAGARSMYVLVEVG